LVCDGVGLLFAGLLAEMVGGGEVAGGRLLALFGAVLGLLAVVCSGLGKSAGPREE
jgi:hypothetical protein